MPELSNDDKSTKAAAEHRVAKNHRNAERRTVVTSLLEGGIIFFDQGDAGDQAYITKSGTIEIFAMVGDQETILGTL